MRVVIFLAAVFMAALLALEARWLIQAERDALAAAAVAGAVLCAFVAAVLAALSISGSPA